MTVSLSMLLNFNYGRFAMLKKSNSAQIHGIIHLYISSE